MKQKLAQVTEKRTDKFTRYFLKHCLTDQDLYQFTESDVFGFYTNFALEYGLQKKVDRHHVISHLELQYPMQKVGEVYTLTDTKRIQYLATLES